MHTKKDDSAKAGKTSSRSAILPVNVPTGASTAYMPPTVNAKPAPHELTPADKTAVKKSNANVAVAHDEKDFKYLASQSQILRASHPGFSQISQSSTPISCTPRLHAAAQHAAVSHAPVAVMPRTQTEYGTWVDRPREADRPRKSEDDKLHKLCQLVTVTAGTLSREDLDDLMFTMIQYVPMKTFLELVQKQVQSDPRRKRNVENILQAFVDDHALKSHHERGTSSSPFDHRNIHNSHSHEVDSISKAKAMTAQGDLPHRPTHPPAVTRRSGEFERGIAQVHRTNMGEHNFAHTYPVNHGLNPVPAMDSHHSHVRRPSFDNGRFKDEQVFAFDHEQGSDNDAGSENAAFDHAEDDSKEEYPCGSPAHAHLTCQPFAHQQRLVQIPALNLASLSSSKPHDHQRSAVPASGFQQAPVIAQNEDDSGSLSARSNGSASIGKGPSAFSPRSSQSPRVSPNDAVPKGRAVAAWGQ